MSRVWRKYKRIYVLGFVLLIGLTQFMYKQESVVIHAAGAEIRYEPIADTYVRDGANAGANFGKRNVLEVKKDSAGYNRTSFITFQFSDFPYSEVEHAKLELTIQSIGADETRVVQLYSLADEDRDWGETGLNWNHGLQGDELLASVEVGRNDQTVEFDVTDYINGQFADRKLSFMLTNTGNASVESSVNFYSREAESGRPALILRAQEQPLIEIIPTNHNVYVGGSVEYRVMLTDLAGEQVDITDTAWLSLDQSGSLEIDQNLKKIIGKSEGTVLVTATLGEITGSTPLYVRNFDHNPIRILGQTIVHEDFEGEIPSFIPDGQSKITVVEEDTGNKALLIDGNGTIAQTLNIEGAYGLSPSDSDYMVEVDVKQLSSVASTNGGISIHTRHSGDQKSYLFRYMDTMRYHETAKVFATNQPVVRDRIGIARQNANTLNEWYYGAFSSSEMGMLNQQNRSFNNQYYKMEAIVSQRLLAADNLVFRVHSPTGIQQVSAHTFIAEDDVKSGVDRLRPGRYLSTLTKGEVYLQTENTKALFDNLRITRIHVARAIQLVFKDNIIAPGQTTGFEVRAYTSDRNYSIIPNDQISFLSADQESLFIDPVSGTIRADAEGDYKITVVAEDVLDPSQTKSYHATLTVRSELVTETFGEEGTGNLHHPDMMSIPATDLIDDGSGNMVYRLQNGISRLMGFEDWTNYEVKGKLKIVRPIIDEELTSSSFEIMMRRQAIQGEYLGQGGYPFAYRHLQEAEDNYMRIGSSPGPKINISDTQWHEFSAKAANNQYIFTIDDVVQYYASGERMQGGFGFRANNMEIYLDDLTINRLEGAPYTTGGEPFQATNLSLEKQAVDVNIYDIVDLARLSAVRAHDNDGRNQYVTSETEYAILTGQNVAELFNGDTFRFKSVASAGDTVVIQASYKGMSDLLTINAVAPLESEFDYINKGTYIRQENLLYTLRNGYEQAVQPIGPIAYKPMAYFFGKIMLDPVEKNYDHELNWMIDVVRYDEGRPSGRSEGAADFFLAELMIIYKTMKDKANVSSSVWAKVEELLKQANYSNQTEFMSENHRLVYFSIGYLVSETWPDEVMWNGQTGLDNQQMFKQYLQDWVERRLRIGMGEYDAVSYYGIDIGALSTLYTFASNQDVKQLSYDMLDYLLADMAVDSIEAKLGGAGGRTYAARNMLYGHANYAVDILFDTSIAKVDEDYVELNVQAGMIPISSYRPSDVLYSLVRDQDKRFTNKERKAIYTIPDVPITESLKKYTHVTPNYVLGSVVQQDIVENDYYHYQGFQEIPWRLTFGKSMNAFIFDSHPGPNETDGSSPHAYFSGDYGAMTYKYFQEENVVLGMHKITGYAQFSHFWIPKMYLDIVSDEDENNGWIFVSEGGVYAAIKLLKNGVVSNDRQYSWSQSGAYVDVEVKIDSPNTAFIVEVADQVEFPGTFAAFKTAILANELANPIEYVIDDGYYIQYRGLNGKLLKIDYLTDEREIDGIAVDFEAYPSHEAISPDGVNYLASAWNSNIITISHASYSKTIQVPSMQGELPDGGVYPPYVPADKESGIDIEEDTATLIFDPKHPTKSIPLEQLTGAELVLQIANASLRIPSVTALVDGAGLTELKGATLEIAVSETASVTGLPAEMQQAGPAYQFSLQLKTTDGKQVALTDRSGSLELIMPYETGYDQELLGIYYYNEAKQTWEYVGGVVNSGVQQMTAHVEQFGTYGVFEYKKVFADVPTSHWATRALQVLAAKHIINGTSETMFTPNGKTTRAEFTAMLVRMLGLSATTEKTPFVDVSSSKWYAADIAIAYEAGLINGVSTEQFAPDRSINREQMAALLVRAYEYVHGNISATGAEYSEFTDQSKMSRWAQAEISKAIAAGLMQGKGKGIFDPSTDALRAETAQAMYNLLQQ